MAQVGQLTPHAVAQADDLGKQDGQRPAVGVTAGVGLDGDVVHHGHAAGEISLLRCDQTGLEQPADDRLGRRAQEALGDLGPGDLGNQPVARPHPAGGVPGQPGQPVAHHLRGEVEEGRRLDAAHLVAQAQVDHVPFHGQLVRAVDEVAREPRASGYPPADRRQRVVDAGGQHPGRAEGGEETLPGQRHDHLRRRDPVGHRPGHVRVAHAVVAQEVRRPQPLGWCRRHHREHLRAGAEQPLVIGGRDPLGVPDDETRPFEGCKHVVDLVRAASEAGGADAARPPVDLGRTGLGGHHGRAPSSRSSTAISVSS